MMAKASSSSRSASSGTDFFSGLTLEELTRNFCVRQFTVAHELINLVQLFFKKCETPLQVTSAVCLDGNGQSLRVSKFGETLSPQQILIEILKLARAGHPY